MQKCKYGIVIACALVISVIGLASTGTLSRSVALTDSEMSEVYGGTGSCETCQQDSTGCRTTPTPPGCYILQDPWQCLGWMVVGTCTEWKYKCKTGTGTCTDTTTPCTGTYTIYNCIQYGSWPDRGCGPDLSNPDVHSCTGSKSWC